MERRNFIWQGSLVAAGLITGKTGTAIAKSHEAYNAAFENRNKLLLLLSPFQKNGENLSLAGKLLNPADWHVKLNRFKNAHNSFILLQQQAINTTYQATIIKDFLNRPGLIPENVSAKVSSKPALFSVVKKDNIRVGIIDLKNYGGPNLPEPQEISRVALHLKEDLQCKIVVCISPMGYKTNESLDDFRLAANTTGIDFIAGQMVQSNSLAGPIVVLNQQKHEVILNYQNGDGMALSAVEWTFNEKGDKSNIAFMG